ncbi:MAG TPA: hypothetical protein VOA88_20390 [Candidatus Dormibacteraeota bacterium]|nr:hypothetical protein [Candidatus Dormibacteraeota bacterium]
MAEESREKDKKILIEILINMEGRLSLIVHQRPDVPGMPHFRREFMEFFPGPWDQVAAHFKLSRAMIEKDEVDWEYVEGIGMTGKTLEWKKRFFDETLRQDVTSRFFEVSNSILGSLSKAIPPLEAVKEYKEHVEAAMRYPRR